MPENTVATMIRALELNETTLEMNAVITKDGQVILLHEPFFNPKSQQNRMEALLKKKRKKSLNIYEMTYAETQRYDVGLSPHPRFLLQQKLPAHKPLLGDVIDSVEAYCKAKKIAPPQYDCLFYIGHLSLSSFFLAPGASLYI